MKPVTVAVLNSLAEAESLQARLASAGLTASVASESLLEEALDFSRAGTGFKVQVSRADFEQALRVVYDWNLEGQSPVRARFTQPGQPLPGASESLPGYLRA